jgi:hypothetical protein
VSITEELFGRKIIGYGLEILEYGRVDALKGKHSYDYEKLSE